MSNESNRTIIEHNNTIGLLAVSIISLFAGVIIGGFMAPPALYVSPDLNIGSTEKPWIDEYQTLVAGVITSAIALIAAYTAWHAIQNQIATTQHIEKEKRDRKARAIRAVMPLSLSGICSYATFIAHSLGRQIQRTITTEELSDIIIEMREFSSDSPIIKNLELCCEYLSDREFEKIRGIISDIQVIEARLRGFAERRTTPGIRQRSIIEHEIQSKIIDCAKLYAKTSKTFNFARYISGEIDVDITYEDIESALHVMGFRDHEFEELHRLLRARYGISNVES